MGIVDDAEWICSCGRGNGREAVFCAACGSARPDPASAPVPAFCASCGARLTSPSAAHCTQCGQLVTAPDGSTARLRIEPQHESGPPPGSTGWVPLPSPLPIESGTERSRSDDHPHNRPRWIVPTIAGSGLVILLAAAIIIFLGTRHDGTRAAKAGVVSAQTANSNVVSGASSSAVTTSASSAPAPLPALGGYAAGVVRPVQAAGAALASDLQEATATQTSLARVHRQAATLQARIASARSALKTGPAYQGAEAANVLLLKAALSEDATYASRVRALSVDPANATDQMFSAIAAAGDSANASYATLMQAVPNVRRTVNGSDGSQLLTDIRQQRQQGAEEATFVGQIESILAQSTGSRSVISTNVAQMQRCNLTPDDAAAQMNSTADERDGLVGQLAAISAPTSASGSALSALRDALTTSEQADRAYANWAEDITDWYYTSPVGCPGGAAPQDGSFAEGQSQSVLASAAKSRFVSIFDPMARRAGQRTWSESEI